MNQNLERFYTVLYSDYNNILSPIHELYWSNASKVCISHHPLSIITDIMSHYCPQCCTRYTEEETSINLVKCPTCHECPRCFSILSISSTRDDADVNSSYLYCFTCTWQSRPYSVKLSEKSVLSLDISKSKFKNSSDDVFNNLLNDLKCVYKDISVPQSQNPSNNKLPISKQDEEITDYTPSEENVENNHNLCFKSQKFHQQSFYSHSSLTGQVINNHTNPIGVSLMTKKMIRCKRDFDQGNSNILVQPKPSPLEGDSSQRVQHGKWWMKDASAIHEIPSITVLDIPDIIHNESLNVYSGIMKFQVSNPKDVDVKCLINFPGNTEDISLWFQSSGCNDKFYQGRVMPHREIRNDLSVSGSCQSIEFILNGFEDELLRDYDDEDVQQNLKLFTKVDQLSDSAIDNVEYKIFRNIALVTLPFSVKNDNINKTVSDAGNLLSSLNMTLTFSSVDLASSNCSSINAKICAQLF